MKSIIAGIIFFLLNLPVYYYLFHKCFPRRGDFRKALKYQATPDIISLFRGEFRKDFMAEFMLGFFFFLCALLLWGEVALFNSLTKGWME